LRLRNVYKEDVYVYAAGDDGFEMLFTDDLQI